MSQVGGAEAKWEGEGCKAEQGERREPRMETIRSQRQGREVRGGIPKGGDGPKVT